MATSKQNFATFLTTMAEKSEKANQATIDKIKEKLEKEQQERIERRVMQVYEEIQMEVSYIRATRNTINVRLARIKDLEKRATKILNGEDD